MILSKEDNKITLYFLKEQINHSSLETQLKIWSGIKRKIPANSSDEVLLLEITKSCLLNGLDFMINNYKVSYPKETSNYNKIRFLKYELIANNLYLYDWYIGREYCVKHQVTKINGVSVQNLIKYLNKDNSLSNEQICKILFHKELLKPINKKKTSDYKVTLLIDEQERTISLNNPNDSALLDSFEKKHETAKLLTKDHFINNKSFLEISNSQLSYAYDSANKLVKILLGLSKNKADRQLFQTILTNQEKLCNINFKSELYLDWMYISSFFLFYDKSLYHLPQYVYDEIALYVNSTVKYSFVLEKDCCNYFLDEHHKEVELLSSDFIHFGSNSQIVEPLNKQYILNYHQLVKTIRNGFAHSSYEIIDEDYVRIYNYSSDEQKLITNLKINKRLIIRIMNQLMEVTNLKNIFPTCCLARPFGEVFDEYKPLETKEEIIYLLDNMIILNLDDLKIFNLDIEYPYILERFKEYSLIGTLNGSKDYILFQLQISELNKYIKYQIQETNPDKDYIMKKINQLGSDFYRHSLSNQFYIINEIIREKSLSEKNISSIIFDIMGKEEAITQRKSSGAIIDIIDASVTGYIHYNKYIQATFISYLNSILLYSYNRNKLLNFYKTRLSHKMGIPMEYTVGNLIKNYERYKMELSTKLKEVEKLKEVIAKEIENSKNELDAQEKLGVQRKIKGLTKQLNNKLQKLNEIDIRTGFTRQELIIKEVAKITEKIVELKAKPFHYEAYIFEHLRNSLAHGNVSFPNGFDYTNIGNTVIKIEDYSRDNKKTFEGTILLKDLLREINNEKLLASIFNNLDTSQFIKC